MVTVNNNRAIRRFIVSSNLCGSSRIRYGGLFLCSIIVIALLVHAVDCQREAVVRYPAKGRRCCPCHSASAAPPTPPDVLFFQPAPVPVGTVCPLPPLRLPTAAVTVPVRFGSVQCPAGYRQPDYAAFRMVLVFIEIGEDLRVGGAAAAFISQKMEQGLRIHRGQVGNGRRKSGGRLLALRLGDRGYRL